MNIVVTDTNLAFEVRLSGGDFADGLACFKDEIPKSCREYVSAGRYWHVERRAINALKSWLEMMALIGANVVQIEQAAPVISMEEATGDDDFRLMKAKALGFLRASDGDGSLIDKYKAMARHDERAAIVVCKMPRWAELRITLYAGALLDEPQGRLFDALLLGCLPGATVRVSRREVYVTRLPFALADELGLWLAVEMNDPVNIEAGQMDGREYGRREARRMLDGSVKVLQGGSARRAA